MAIELRHLRYVIAVAETGQLTRAAARLHIAQPALSQSLLRLERELGTPLFDRHPRGVDLTPAGDAFLEHARAAVAAGDAAVGAARQAARVAADRLVLGFMNGGVMLTEPLLANFAGAHPGVEVLLREVSWADMVDWLLDGTVDAMILCPGPPSPDFESVPLCRTSLCVFVGGSHPLSSRTELRYADIADETYLRTAPGVPDWWTDIWYLTERRGHRPKLGRHTSGTINESLAALLTGEVVVVTPTFLIPPTPVPDVHPIPLVDVEAPDAELVLLRGRATPAARRLAAVARSLRPQAA